MPVTNIYSNPIEQSSKSSALGVGIPRSRTISVFGGRGQEVMELIQLVAINFGMLSTLPDFGPGPTGIATSGTGSTAPATYPQLPYPGSNPTGLSAYPNPSLTGTVAVSTASATVTGTGTLFLTQVLVGDVLYDVTTSTVIGTVQTINSNTSITLTGNSNETATGSTVRTGDSIGSQYRVWNSVPAKYYLDDVQVLNPAIAGATGFQLGTYKPFYGDVVDADVLGTALDFSTAHTYPSFYHVANNLSLIQRSEPLWEMEGGAFDKEPNALDIVLTSTVAPTAAGVIYIKSTWITPIS